SSLPSIVSLAFFISFIISFLSSTYIICCERIMDANCILIFIHRISNGSIDSISLTISIVSFGKYLANNPCDLALEFFFIFLGGAPVDFPPWSLHRPFPGVLVPHPAGLLQGVPALVLAPQYFLSWALFCIYIYTTVLI